MIFNLKINYSRKVDNLHIDMKNEHSRRVDYLHIDMKKEHYSMIRRYDHAFFLWNISAQSLIVEFFDHNFCFFIYIELRRFYRRFDHFSIQRLQAILDRSNHDVNSQAIEYFIKYCHHCQLHEKFSNRFSFTLKDDIEFNFNIIVNIFYIEVKHEINKSILHLMNEATRFQANK
jgi:hypothetical protein